MTVLFSFWGKDLTLAGQQLELVMGMRHSDGYSHKLDVTIKKRKGLIQSLLDAAGAAATSQDSLASGLKTIGIEGAQLQPRADAHSGPEKPEATHCQTSDSEERSGNSVSSVSGAQVLNV